MGHRPASIPPVVLDSGTTSNTTTTLDSAEEEETNGNLAQLQIEMMFRQMHLMTVQIFQRAAQAAQAKKSVDEAGVYV